jgi:hypothetical protein
VRHARLREQLSAYLDGQLSSRELRRMDRHLGRCPECRSELDGLRQTVDLLQALPKLESPPGLEARLLAHVQEAEQAAEERASRRWWTRFGVPVATLAGAALAAAMFIDVDVSVDWPGSPALREAELQSITLSSRPYVVAPQVAPGPSLFLPAGTTGASTGTAGAWSAASDEVILGAARPSMRACLPGGGSDGAEGQAAAPREACSQWQSWMLDLAGREPRAFVSEFETVPESEQPLILQDIRELAWGTGTASFVIDRLRSSGDPRASSLASRLAFASARGDR